MPLYLSQIPALICSVYIKLIMCFFRCTEIQNGFFKQTPCSYSCPYSWRSKIFRGDISSIYSKFSTKTLKWFVDSCQCNQHSLLLTKNTSQSFTRAVSRTPRRPVIFITHNPNSLQPFYILCSNH